MNGILVAIVGFIICAILIAITGALILALVLWMFNRNLDFDDFSNPEYWEERK